MRHSFKMQKKCINIALTFLMIFSLIAPSLLTVNVPKVEAAEATVAGIADHVVISQVYGYGGSAGQDYMYKFVELYNPTDQVVDLKGWSLQYASAGSNFSTNANNLFKLTGKIQPKGYYLVQAASNTTPPVEGVNGKPTSETG